jgi:hypothetical protein
MTVRNDAKLFSGKLFAVPERNVYTRFAYLTRPFPYIETSSRPDVHFDGPKMDETSEATHEVKGLGCLKRT